MTLDIGYNNIFANSYMMQKNSFMPSLCNYTMPSLFNFTVPSYNNFTMSPLFTSTMPPLCDFTMPSYNNYTMPPCYSSLTPSFLDLQYQMSNLSALYKHKLELLSTMPSSLCPFSSLSNISNTSNTSYKRNYLNVKNAEKLGPEFLEKTKQVAKRVNCDYKDLLALMNSESGLNPQARNSNGGATGLIQFMPNTAKNLGTSTDALRNMSGVEQLDYVEKYLMNAKSRKFSNGRKLSAGDLCALTFLPARAGQENLTSVGESYYAANKGLDTNKDGTITTSELSARIASKSVNESLFA